MKPTPNVITVNPIPIKLYDRDFLKDDKMKEKKKYTYIYCLKPLHVLLALFAMSRVPYSSKLVKILHTFSMIALLAILVGATIKWRFDYVYIDMTSIMFTTDIMALIMLSVTSFCNLLVVGFQSPYIQQALYKNHITMDSMLDLNTSFKYKKGRWVVLKIIASILIPIFVISCFDVYANLMTQDFRKSAPFMINYLLYIMNSLVSAQFVIAMYSVRVQFLVLNVQLQIFIEKKLDFKNFDDNSKEYRTYYNPSIIEETIFHVRSLILEAKIGVKGKQIDINKITNIYMLNCDQCHLYDEYFNVQNFLMTLNSIISILKSLHMVSVYASSNEQHIFDSGKIYLMLITLGFALYDILMLYIITGSCEYVVNEAKKTSVIMDAMIYKRAFENLDEITVCSQLVSRRMPKFTGLGFFNMDFTLLSTIAGTIATYLVMLIQVKA